MKTSNLVSRIAGIACSLGVLLFPLSFASAALTLTINSLSPGAALKAGETLTFTAVGSGADSLAYFVFDDFNNSSLNSSAMNSTTGAFSWAPSSQDNGTHNLSVEASDGKGLVKIITQTITVGTVAPQYSLAIQSISPGSIVSTGQTVTFSATPSGFSATTYSLSDSFAGSSINNSNINSSGIFSWSPVSADVGSHPITVTASDSSGHSASKSSTFQVNASTILVPLSTPTAAVPTPAPVSTPVVTTYSYGPSLSSLQIQAITAILQAFGASQSMIAQVSAILSGSYVASTAASTAVSTTVSSAPATPTASKYTFVSFLTLGSNGAEVSELQKKLGAEGFLTGGVTGYYGTATESAVKQYQSAHGISAMGFVGPATRDALNSK